MRLESASRDINIMPDLPTMPHAEQDFNSWSNALQAVSAADAAAAAAAADGDVNTARLTPTPPWTS